ncbi:hypothetical protein K7X08_001971 [Anisodus acutangulus]|uniref:Cytochrome P450 n=1 Tax=Anisodus acutangulus TaxID=402998 RepID=A0A9Q1LS51_9SOLA|nr:hypothetical protein K7X08_001971 [Anisodus acutangulus]
MVAGKRWAEPSHDMFGPTMIMNICDHIPLLQWVGFQGLEKNLVEFKKTRDKFVQGLIDECRKSRDDDLSLTVHRKTIIHTLLSLQRAQPECYTYDIIKGVIMEIQRNSKNWEEPNTFKPERFEGIEGSKFLPFGMGRRACPGSGLAMRLIGLSLGLFIQCFEWERIGPGLVGLSESCGLT